MIMPANINPEILGTVGECRLWFISCGCDSASAILRVWFCECGFATLCADYAIETIYIKSKRLTEISVQ